MRNTTCGRGADRGVGRCDRYRWQDPATVLPEERRESPDPQIHTVSAFAARQRLVLGQIKVAEKSNEIVATPKLLDLLDIEGTIESIDAMGNRQENRR
jgi:hypothetical protein